MLPHLRPPRLRVTLVNPAVDRRLILGRYAAAMQPVVPTGLAYVAAAARAAGHTVSLLDAYALDLPLSACVHEILRLEPDVVGLSVLTPAADDALALSRALKACRPQLTILWGNVHARVFDEELLETGLVDGIVRLEGEETFVACLEALARGEAPLEVPGLTWRQDNQIHRNPERPPIQDLDGLPWPAFDLLSLPRYVAPPMLGWMAPILPVQASRGCAFRCHFCSQENVQPGVRLRSAEAVVEEVDYHQKRFNIQYMGFLDANFPAQRDQGLAVAEGFLKRGIPRRLRWLTEARADLLDETLLEALAEAGLRLLMIGFESGAQSLLDRAGKGSRVDQGQRVMDAARRLGITVLGLFMLGLPGETRETVEQTVRLALALDPDFAKFNLAVPLPGSRFFEEWRASHPGPLDFSRFSAWVDRSQPDRLLHVPEGMTALELLTLRDEAMRRFYLRPRFVARHLRRGTLGLEGAIRGVKVFFVDWARASKP